MKNFLRLISAICVLAMIFTSFTFAEDMILIAPNPNSQSFVEDFSDTTFNGVSLAEYTIVLGTDATTAIKNTVDCFIGYINEATGSDIAIAADGESADYEICIGLTDRETEKVTEARKDIGTSGIAIISDSCKIFLTGDGELGVIYAMYQFLEDYLGYRFYAPDFYVAKHEYATDFPSDLCFVYNPSIEIRDTDFRDVFVGKEDPHSGKYDLEYANSLKLNGVGARKFWTSASIANQYGGYFPKYAGGGAHSFAPLAEIGWDEQPCLSDEAVYQKVLANVKKTLDEHPEATVIDVSQCDNWDFCKCEKCSALDMQYSPDGVSPVPAASILTFVNRIARDIKEEYPDVIVQTLAYAYSIYPPIGMKAEDNVAIRLCNIECCFAHALSDESCTYNGGVNPNFAENIVRWGEICNQLYIWDYAFNAYYMHTYPNLGIMYDNICFFDENNVTFVYEQGNNASRDAEFSRLRIFLMSKVMWNTDMTREEYNQLMDDFLRDYYGAGWRYIKRYLELCTESAQRYHMGIFVYPYEFLRTLSNTDAANKEFYSELVNLWNKAYNRAETAVQKQHVRAGRTQAEFLYLEKFYDPSTDVERADELYCDLLTMQSFCIKENYYNLFPRRWKFIQGPDYWYEY